MTDQGSGSQTKGVEGMSLAEPAPAQGPATPPAPRMTAAERESFFRQVYDAHFNYVWHSLRRYGVWERDLEDAAHDVFIVVHKKLDEFDQSRPVKPWLLGISFRVASDFRRRAQHKREVVDDDVMAVDESTQRQDAVLAQKEQQALVYRAMDTLDTDKRAVFVLHELEGHTMPVIAETLGVPLNTCYSRLRLARERFTQAVRQLQAERAANGTMEEVPS